MLTIGTKVRLDKLPSVANGKTTEEGEASWSDVRGKEGVIMGVPPDGDSTWYYRVSVPGVHTKEYNEGDYSTFSLVNEREMTVIA